MKKDLPKIIVIEGPTASGKSALGIHLAKSFNGEIVNADSMQIYRLLDIGTDKPSLHDQQGISHHLLNIIDPHENYSAGDFARSAANAIELIGRNQRIPFIIGGTHFYIHALLNGLCDMPVAQTQIFHIRQKLQRLRKVYALDFFYKWAKKIDAAAMRSIDANDFYRVSRILEVFYGTGKKISFFRSKEREAQNLFPQYQVLKIGLSMPREILYQRINERVLAMVEKGWILEVKQLLEMGFATDVRSLNTLGYKWMRRHVDGEISLEDAIKLTQRDTRHFAKRQLTWLRKDPEIHWVDYRDGNNLGERLVSHFLKALSC